VDAPPQAELVAGKDNTAKPNSPHNIISNPLSGLAVASMIYATARSVRQACKAVKRRVVNVVYATTFPVAGYVFWIRFPYFLFFFADGFVAKADLVAVFASVVRSYLLINVFQVAGCHGVSDN
jgi:O-antigen/teichoic acid export membrane protein